MPELGKATYFLVADTREFDAAMAHADEVSAASSTSVGRSMNRASASVGKLGASAGATSKKIARDEEGMAEAATASSRAISRAHAAAETSYVRMGATGTKAYERMKIGPLAAIGVTLYEGIKTFKENALAAGQLDQAYSLAGRTAGLTRKGFDELTDSMDKNSTFTKAQIMYVEQLSLGLRNVKDKSGYVQTVLNLAAKMGVAPAVAAKAYGRALADPAQGLQKLGRMGVFVSDGEKKMAKTITETSGVLAGQAYVAQVVAQRTQGMAKAAANSQPWIMLWKTFKEIAASMVGGITPAFKALLGAMNAHKTTVKVLVGSMLALAATYVAVKAAEKAWIMYKTTSRGVLIAWNVLVTLMGKNNLRLAESQALATRAERLNTAATYENTAAKIRNAAASARAGAGNLLRGGATGALTGAVGIGAIGLGAIATLNHFKNVAGNALSDMEKNEKRFNVKTEEALSYYAASVQKYVKKGWDRAAAKTQAQADVFGHLGVHIGQKTGEGVAKGLSAQEKKIKDAMKGIMDGLKSSVVDAQAALNVAMAHGAPPEILKTLGQSAADAAYDAAHGAQGAAQAVRDAQQKILEQHKAWLDKMKGLATDHMDKITTALTAKLQGAKDKLSSAFGTLSEVMFRAFDANTQAGLAKFDKALQSFQDKIQKAITAANKKIDAGLARANDALSTLQGQLTPAEQKLKDMQDAANATSQREALSDAQGQLAKAKTPAEIAAAQRAVRDAQNAITMSALERQAAIERAAKDKEFDLKRKALEDTAQAERDAYQAQMDRMQKAYETRINQAKLDYDSERALYKNHLQLWLNEELAWLQKHPTQWKRVFNQLVSVFGPDVKRAGKLIGRGFIGEFRDAVNQTAKTSLKYSGALASAANALGRNLAYGIVGGMKSLAPALYKQMIASVNAAFKAFGIAYRMHSPSKKTEEDIGKPLGQGVVVGFAKAVEPLTRDLDVARPTGRGASFGSTMSPSVMQRAGARIAEEGPQRAGVTIVQHIKRVDPDPFQLAHEAAFAADGVFG